jgi:nucleotide-binding universal stress UspA family protein
MERQSEIQVKVGLQEEGRGIALLVLAGSPTEDVLTTMRACAENLGRELVTATVQGTMGGAIVSQQQLAQIAALVQRSRAAVVVVAGQTPTRFVRRLAAAGRRPVLVARTRQKWTRILAATDLQSRGFPIVAAASAVATAHGADSVVLHNVAPSWAATAATFGAAGRMATGVAGVRRLLRTAARSVPRPKVIVSASARPARAIVDAFAARHADLLVLGMRRPHGRPGARCADHVVATVPGNVLVVPLTRRRNALRKGAPS